MSDSIDTMTLPQATRFARNLLGELVAHGLILRMLMQQVPGVLDAVKAIDLDEIEELWLAGAVHDDTIRSARKKLADMQKTPPRSGGASV